MRVYTYTVYPYYIICMHVHARADERGTPRRRQWAGARSALRGTALAQSTRCALASRLRVRVVTIYIYCQVLRARSGMATLLRGRKLLVKHPGGVRPAPTDALQGKVVLLYEPTVPSLRASARCSTLSCVGAGTFQRAGVGRATNSPRSSRTSTMRWASSQTQTSKSCTCRAIGLWRR